MDDSKDLLSQILFEAKSYNTFEDIEKLVEINSDLSQIPVQPLYVSLVSSSSDQVARVLPKLSSEQRQVMVDLDLWYKDRIDVGAFEFWIEVYSKVQDLEYTKEFVSSDDFLIYLKSRVNIWTFDAEDPEYPDHDYYFLTDDNLLLVEYSEDYRYPNELKYLIRNMYDKFGVENAYSMLFKLINDSYSLIEEEGFQLKKERLREYGFVDHFDALEKLSPFITLKQIDNFIQNKKSITAKIDNIAKNQSLHSSALVSFDAQMENILNELSKVTDSFRANYLHFTFIRLINSTITLNNALKGGRVELTRIGKVTKVFLELGLQKIKYDRDLESIFDTFDFFDVYRIGQSLILNERTKIKKALKNTPFIKDDESFLGSWWVSFLENSDFEVPKIKSFGAAKHTQSVSSLPVYYTWRGEINLFVSSVPFIYSFYNAFQELKIESLLHDDFYLNYDVCDIDFEAIILSSFINFSIGNYDIDDNKKMGVTVADMQNFFNTLFQKIGEEYVLHLLESKIMTEKISNFVQKFGLSSIDRFDTYLYGILTEHLSGYEFDTLDYEDYKHVGGPIILNSTSKI